MTHNRFAIPGARGRTHKVMRWLILLSLIAIALLVPVIFLRSIIYVEPEIGVAVIALLFVAMLIAMPMQNREVNLKLFFSVIAFYFGLNIMWPDYGAIDFPGAPAINPQRILSFLLVGGWLFIMATYRPVLFAGITQARLAGIVTFAILAAVALKMLAIPFSPYKAQSITSFIDQIIVWYMPFFLALTVIRSRSEIDLLMKIIVYSCGILGIVCLVERLTEFNPYAHLILNLMPEKTPWMERMLHGYAMKDGPGFDWRYRDGWWRAWGPSWTAMNIAQLFAIAVPFAVYLYEKAKGRSARILLALSMVSLFIGTWSTGTRTAMLGAMGILVLHVFIRLAPKVFGKEAKGRATPAIALGMALMLIAAPVGFVGALEAMDWRSALGADGSRTQMFIHAIPKVAARPVIGYGVGNVVAGLVLDYRFGNDNSSIDSFPLTVTLETGFPGLAVFLIPIFFMGYVGLKRAYQMDEDGQRYYAFGMFALAFFLSTTTLSEGENHYIFYIMLGAFLAFHSGRLLDGAPTGTTVRVDVDDRKRSRQRRLAHSPMRGTKG